MWGNFKVVAISLAIGRIPNRTRDFQPKELSIYFWIFYVDSYIIEVDIDKEKNTLFKSTQSWGILATFSEIVSVEKVNFNRL